MDDDVVFDPGPGPRRSVQVTLRVDPDLYTDARQDALGERVSLNEWISRAVQERLIRKASRLRAQAARHQATGGMGEIDGGR